MKGWQIFLHSVRQVTGNFEAALKVSLIPVLIQTAVSLVLVGGSAQMTQSDIMEQPGAMTGFGISMVVVVLVALITSIWVAVNWHRFVLLGEEPAGYVPPFPWETFKAYLLRSLSIAAVMIAAVVVLGMIGGAISGVFYRIGGSTLGLIAMGVIVWLPLTLLGLRLSAALPGSALGTDSAFLAGWNATRDANKDIAVLAVISVLANLAISLLGSLFGSIPVLGLGIGFLTSWLVTMIGLSILTTLYGHYVEGRALG